MDRQFDYVPRLVDANRNYRITAAPLEKSIFWIGGKVLDQGQEGACVGFATSGEYGASPVRGVISDKLAFNVYNRAKEIDEWEGVNYEGTSVRAGMLVGREKGWWSNFYWAFNMAELKTALRTGPVVIGIEWREDMYIATNGVVKIGGPVVGGHAILINGYSPNYLGRGPTFRWRNSWGTSYGLNGNGYISQDNLDKILFQSGGEAACPTNRRLTT